MNTYQKMNRHKVSCLKEFDKVEQDVIQVLKKMQGKVGYVPFYLKDFECVCVFAYEHTSNFSLSVQKMRIFAVRYYDGDIQIVSDLPNKEYSHEEVESMPDYAMNYDFVGDFGGWCGWHNPKTRDMWNYIGTILEIEKGLEEVARIRNDFNEKGVA